MKYRAVRVLASYADRDSTVDTIDAALAEWANAGWTLHSQSMTTVIGGGGGMYPAQSTHEIVLLIFEKEHRGAS
jgi:hypothetical protein